jgi:hypothetical protein
MELMEKEGEYHDGFMAEFDFVVANCKIKAIHLQLDGGFENELNFPMVMDCDVDVDVITGGDGVYPDYLSFWENGDVTFSLLFVDNSVPSDRTQTDFLELLWTLSLIERIKFEEANSDCPEFASKLNQTLEKLRTLKCSSEIEPWEFYGFLF